MCSEIVLSMVCVTEHCDWVGGKCVETGQFSIKDLPTTTVHQEIGFGIKEFLLVFFASFLAFMLVLAIGYALMICAWKKAIADLKGVGGGGRPKEILPSFRKIPPTRPPPPQMRRQEEVVHLEQVELGQVELGQVELGQVELGQVEMGQVELGQVELEQVELEQVELEQVELEQVKLEQVELEQVELEQVVVDEVELEEVITVWV